MRPSGRRGEDREYGASRALRARPICAAIRPLSRRLSRTRKAALVLRGDREARRPEISAGEQ